MRADPDFLRKRSMTPLRSWGMAGVGVAVALGGVWAFRLPLAEAGLRSWMGARGIESAFTVTRADLGGVTVRDLRLGSEGAHDFTASEARADTAWGWTGPRLAAVALTGPELRARWTADGLSLGALDGLRGPPDRPPSPLPRIRLEVTNGRVLVDAQSGRLDVAVRTSGTLGADFAGVATLNPQNIALRDATISGLSGRLEADTAADGALLLRLAGEAAEATTPIGGVTAPTFTASIRAPLDLAALAGEVAVAAPGAQAGNITLQALTGRIALSGAAHAWAGEATLAAERAGGAVAGRTLALSAAAEGDQAGGAGTWRLSAADLAVSGVTAKTASGEGPLTLTFADRPVLSASGAVRAEGVAAPGLSDAIPDLAGLPLEPVLKAAKAALARAAADARFSGAADLRLGSETRLRLTELEATSTSSANLAKGLVLNWSPQDGLTVSGATTLSGGGLPTITVARLSATDEGLDLDFTVPETRADGATLGIADGRITLADAAFRVSGRLSASGPAAGAAVVTGLTATLNLSGGTAPFRLAAAGGCQPLRIARLEALGLAFDAARVDLCGAGPGGAILSSRPAGVTGAFTLTPLILQGRQIGANLPVSVRAEGLRLELAAQGADTTIDVTAGPVSYAVTFDAARTLTASAATLTADTRVTGGAWATTGVFSGAVIEDPTLPVNVTDGSGDWSAAPNDAGEAVVRIADARARVTDKEPIPRFTPLALADVAGVLDQGLFTSQGEIRLAADGTRLARYEATHDLEAGEGQAGVFARDLTFSRDLELTEVTELARGVVENVRGPVDADFQARWTTTTFAVDGSLTLKDLSMATIALGPIEGLSGSIRFDDATLLTTPPGQSLTVRRINPGVPVENGTLTFGIERDLTIALEAATFPFADGVLSVDPVRTVVGAPESRFTLRLQDVDVADVLARLDFKDVSATGRVQGVFPLVFTPSGGRIEGGRLEADPEGGTITLANVPKGSDPISQLAFDALRGFRYERLSIGVNGALDGEIVSSIRFEGVNQTPISAPVAGPFAARGQTGVPFRYNVTVTAPFRALVDQADSFSRPLDAARRAAQPKAADPTQVP